jgi:hypothetical protein
MTTLSGGDIRDEPVPQKKPAGIEKVDKIENRGVTGEQEDHVRRRESRQWGAKATNPVPSGSGMRTRRIGLANIWTTACIHLIIWSRLTF